MAMHPEQLADMPAETPEVLALRDEIEVQKNLIRETCLKMGKAYYDAHKNDDEETMDEEVKTVRTATDVILANQDKIRALKGLMLCPECRAEISVNAMFCNHCGLRLREPEPEPEPEEAPVPTVCAVCGKELHEGQRFCTGCGTPVPVAAPAAKEAPAKRLCPNCGTELPVEAKFCYACGKPQE